MKKPIQTVAAAVLPEGVENLLTKSFDIEGKTKTRQGRTRK